MTNYYLAVLADANKNPGEFNVSEMKQTLRRILRDERYWPKSICYSRLFEAATLFHEHNFTCAETDTRVFNCFLKEYHCRTGKREPAIFAGIAADSR